MTIVDVYIHSLLGILSYFSGTNERALIDIIANRSNAQRQQIKTQYKSMYGVVCSFWKRKVLTFKIWFVVQDLIKQLGGELSGHFKETITALFDSPANFDAWSLHEAFRVCLLIPSLFIPISSFQRCKEGTLREILLTRTNSEIREIVEAYRQCKSFSLIITDLCILLSFSTWIVFRKELEKDLSSHVRGTDFKRILISAVQVSEFVDDWLMIDIQPFKANRDELTPQQIQQARQSGIESVIDRYDSNDSISIISKSFLTFLLVIVLGKMRMICTRPALLNGEQMNEHSTLYFPNVHIINSVPFSKNTKK